MEIAFIGLGKMGGNLAAQVLEKGYSIIGYDVSEEAVQSFRENEVLDDERVKLTTNYEQFRKWLKRQQIIFVLVPHGKVTNEVLQQLVEHAPEEVYVIEGGNSNYKEALKWFYNFENSNKYFFDMGTSGGLEGARYGMCAMIGGDPQAFQQIEPFLKEVCCSNGLLYTGRAGSGHFLKMVHNGIEYGMMQAIAEGYELLEQSPFEYDFKQVSEIWSNGSVIRSWLIELLIDVFDENPNLQNISGKMNASGEAQWFVEEAMALKVPVPVTALSLMMRNRSQQENAFSGKVVSALRTAFGGHTVERGSEDG